MAAGFVDTTCYNNNMFRRSKTSEGDVASPSVSATTATEQGRSTTQAAATADQHMCYACGESITAATSHILIPPTRITGGKRRYHTDCFRCYNCNLPIDPKSQTLCFSESDRKQKGGNNNQHEQHPFHKSCYDQCFGWKCVVCEQTLPIVAMNNGSATKFGYLKHPFFDNEVSYYSGDNILGTQHLFLYSPIPFITLLQRMCPHHATGTRRRRQEQEAQLFRQEEDNVGVTTTEEAEIGEIRRCAGCHRFEPKFASSSKHFIDVGDSDTGRCVCLACCRTVVTNSDEVIPLWEQVVNFFEGYLGLITDKHSISGVSRQTLMSIPVMMVGLDALNDNMKKHSKGVHYKSSQVMTRGLCLSEFCGHNAESVGVNAILCLSGLPADLTKSVLAHECTHAFIKLHPNFRYGKQLPLMVEEGLCQLVAFLFLNDGLQPCDNSTEDDSIPSDAKLRQYFKFCIETDESLYGEGFRLAARAYAQMGMQELLYYIALNREFPLLD